MAITEPTPLPTTQPATVPSLISDGPSPLWLLVWLAAALIALFVLWRRGRLSPGSLAHAPQRQTGLLPLDVFVCLALFLLGNQALFWLGGPNLGRPQTPSQVMSQTLLAQVLGKLPMVAYLVIRLASQPGGIREFGLFPRRPRLEAAAGLAGLLAGLPLVMGLTSLVVLIGLALDHQPPKTGHELLKWLIQSDSAGVRLGLIFSAVVLAPILEEILFRGLVQTLLLQALGPNRRWTVIALASALFSLVHAGGAATEVLPGLMALGLVLGWLYERHGSLLPCVLAHAGFNLINVLLSLWLPGA